MLPGGKLLSSLQNRKHDISPENTLFSVETPSWKMFRKAFHRHRQKHSYVATSSNPNMHPQLGIDPGSTSATSTPLVWLANLDGRRHPTVTNWWSTGSGSWWASPRDGWCGAGRACRGERRACESCEFDYQAGTSAGGLWVKREEEAARRRRWSCVLLSFDSRALEE